VVDICKSFELFNVHHLTPCYTLYRFELVPAVEGEVPQKEIEIILRAKHGIHLKLLPRNLSH